METYIQYIALIDQYLNKLISKEARLDFESELESNIEFHTVYQEHIVFLNGLQRISLKKDIQNAKRVYQTEKWLKISGLILILIAILTSLFLLIYNSKNQEPDTPIDDYKTTIEKTSILKQSTHEIVEDTEKSSEKTESIVVKPSSNSEEKATAQPLERFTKKQAQLIRIHTQNDTIIQCKEGTILKIDKQSFVNPKTGTIATGTLELSVTEYYKLSDMLLANLSTVSNEHQLETGGMLFIEATQENSILSLAKNAMIAVSFPTKTKKPDMQIFSGAFENENMDWKLQEHELSVEYVQIAAPDEHVEVPFNVVDQVPTFPGCDDPDDEVRKKCTQDAIAKFINRNFNTTVSLNLSLKGKERINSIFKIDRRGYATAIQSKASDPKLEEEANRVIALLPKMIPGRQGGKAVTVPYSLPIYFSLDGEKAKINQSNNGAIPNAVRFNRVYEDSLVEMDSVYMESRGMVEYIREVMHDKYFPVDSVFIGQWEQYKKRRLIRNVRLETKHNHFETAVILRKPLFEMESTKFKVLEGDSITRGGHVVRLPWDSIKIPTTTRFLLLSPKPKFDVGNETLTSEEFETRLKDENDTSISSREANYYILKSSDLGWINCDRFIQRSGKSIRYKLKIKNSDGARVSMVFKTLNSILPSYTTNEIYDFKTVPIDAPIILVAIKRKNGKLYYDIIETHTEANPQIDFDFKETTFEALEDKLNLLKK